MSNFVAKVKNKKTNRIVTASFLDDYFGRHRYGIEIDGKVLTETEFSKEWERFNE